MRRRRFLAASGTAFVGGFLAGCSGSGPKDNGNGDSSTTKGGTANETSQTSETAESNGFALTSVNVPNEVVMGKEFTLEFTIKNNGTSARAFQSPIDVSTGSGTQQSGTLETGTIPPGKTKTWSKKLSYPYVSTVTYNLAEFGKSFSVNIVGKTLSIGETFSSPNSVAVTVQDITLTSHYRFVRGNGEVVDVEADDGRQWAFVTVKAKNEFRMRQSLPKRDSFHLLVGKREDKPTQIRKEEGKYKLERFGRRDVASGESLTGWLAYDISADRSADELSVKWNGSDSNGSWWTRWSP